MAWYDVFSSFYDASLEPLYREARARAATALAAPPGATILDVPCGTGQSFPHLLAACPEAQILGVDLSAGMLRQARRRVVRDGLAGVELRKLDARTATAAELGARPDRLHIFLGMSVFPDPGLTFDNLWSLLRPGGLAVVVDVHADPIGFQGRLVNWVAGADIRRRFWEPLEARGEGFTLHDLPSLQRHGGQIRMAIGRKES